MTRRKPTAAERARHEQINDWLNQRHAMLTMMGMFADETIELFETEMGNRSIYWTKNESVYQAWQGNVADLEAQAVLIPDRPPIQTWLPKFVSNPERIVPHLHEAVSSKKITRSDQHSLAFGRDILSDPLVGPLAKQQPNYTYHVKIADLLGALNLEKGQLRRRSGTEHRVRVLCDGVETRFGFNVLCVLSQERPELVEGGRNRVKRKDAKNDPQWSFGGLELFAA